MNGKTFIIIENMWVKQSHIWYKKGESAKKQFLILTSLAPLYSPYRLNKTKIISVLKLQDFGTEFLIF